MKKLILLILVAFTLSASAQTVGDKSTELGYNLGQKVLDGGVNIYTHFKADTFVCYKIEAAIPADSLQLGSTVNFYYFDTYGCQFDSTLTQSVRDSCAIMNDSIAIASVQNLYKDWLSLQPYNEISKPDSVIIKQ